MKNCAVTGRWSSWLVDVDFNNMHAELAGNTLSINCEDIYDPDQDVNLRSHVGWHHGILETLSKVDRFIQHLNNILEFVTQQEDGSKVLVDLECKSGRHRSVGQGFAAFRCLKVLGYDVVLIHASSWKWGEMRCDGVCHGCKDMAASLGQIRHLIPNMSRLARSRGSVTSSRDVRDAPTDDASGGHPSHPTADHPTAGHPTTDQLDEIRRLVQGLATDVRHLRTEQVEIKRMAETGRRSRSPPTSTTFADTTITTSTQEIPKLQSQDASLENGWTWQESPKGKKSEIGPIFDAETSGPSSTTPFRTCQGPTTDPDLQGPRMDPELQRCHNNLENLPMIAMSLSDWSETIWHQMDRLTTRTCQWRHWTVSFLAKLYLFASVRVTGIGSFGFASLVMILKPMVSGWMSWFATTSGPIELSRLRTASSTGSDLHGSDLAMEALGSSLKTTLTVQQRCVWTIRGSMWLCFTTHQGCLMTPGGEHTWAFVSSWPPTSNYGM